jgi:hypothetical protein
MVWGRVTLCRATHITWVSALGCLTIQRRPNSKANCLTMLKHLFPLFEYRSEATSGQLVLGWVTALCDIPLQGKMLIAAVGYRCCITSWGIDQNSREHRTNCTLISQPWSHIFWFIWDFFWIETFGHVWKRLETFRQTLEDLKINDLKSWF